MSAQQITQLLISFVLITAVALVSERSRFLSSLLSVMPLKVALALWFVFGNTGGDRVLSADFCRMSLFALIPTALFLAACWLGLRQGWAVGKVLGYGYGVWLIGAGVYRGIEWWLTRG